MTVKIVTDSTADLPLDLAMELDINIVPVYVRFGDKVYREGVDIGSDEFYPKLKQASSPAGSGEVSLLPLDRPIDLVERRL